MAEVEEFQRVLRRASELGFPESPLMITAYLSEKFGGFVVVGGFATALYSLGMYVTADVDVVVAMARDMDGLRKLEDGLKRLGFRRNRVWCHDEAKYALDVVSGYPPERTKTFEIGGYKVEVASPEEALINDLAGYKFWNEGAMLERAILVFKAQRERLDTEYLRKRARVRDVEDALDELERLAS